MDNCASCGALRSGAENEASNEHYAGLHQWNFRLDDGLFVVESRTERCVVSRELANMGEFACMLEWGWLTVRIRKLEAHL